MKAERRGGLTSPQSKEVMPSTSLRRFWHEQSIVCQPQRRVSHPPRQAVAATVPWLRSEGHGTGSLGLG